jgi:deferrochelatase/peroxidase EfeB
MNHRPDLSRRTVLAGGLGLAGTLAIGKAARSASPAEPFRGPHQGGIVGSQQSHSYFAAYDLVTRQRGDVEALLKAWTAAAERMARGETALPVEGTPSDPAADGGAALGLSPSRLTVTFGFGPGLFVKDGQDRYNLAARRPDALVDLPKFDGDQLDPARGGGDISVQACADDPQVAFHAVRELERLGYRTIRLRWAQTGFLPNTPPGQTPRNLMGFKDGTNNPGSGPVRPDVPLGLDKVVWVGDEGPGWMRGGTYLVVRRIRISLEHWDRMAVEFQEEVIGRHKYSGAAIGKRDEFEPLDLAREAADGSLVIAENAHVRLGSVSATGGAQIHRRAYSYNDGARFTAERWPPWRQGMMYDAGLFFLAYQRDPRTGFIPIFETMARQDMMNQFTTHNGSAIFACPGGVDAAASPGAFIGQGLFDQI